MANYVGTFVFVPLAKTLYTVLLHLDHLGLYQYYRICNALCIQWHRPPNNI